MNALTFGTPEWLWGLIAIPLLALLYVRAERRGALRLEQFVAAKLLPDLAATVNRGRRALKFALLLLGLALSLAALAKPRWGYTYEDVKRKGLDLLLAIDTSRSMLSNDVQPNRLQRVKLSTQDLITELQGDRVGLIAFAGRAFLQAPLTIDYDAAVEAINDIDTNTIPEGGTNISEAINLAVKTFGKSASGNRALIVFTDGEELSGDAAKTARAAADAGVRIFTIGVGTPEGSLIPVSGEGGGTAFVKDGKGQVVKSKLDEKRLREIAEATGGGYLHLEDGPRTMRKLFSDGLSKMQAGEIDARLSRRPIERYQWPLGAALAALAASFVITDRRRARPRAVSRSSSRSRRTLAAAAITLAFANRALAGSPGLDAYRSEHYPEAYQQFDETLKKHPQNQAEDKLHFDAGAAAYKMKDYGKALDSFSQALLSPNAGLQGSSHYNLGNTLYERGETQKADDKKLSDWTNALQHYEQTLKLDPKNKLAKDNYEFVKKKIEELKKKKEQEPSPTPTPSPQPDKNKQKDEKKKQDQDKQDSPKQDQQQKDQQKDKQDQQPQKDQSGSGNQQKPEKDQPKDGSSKSDSKGNDKNDEGKPAESPSPNGSPTPADPKKEKGNAPSPTASPVEKQGGDKGESPGDQPQPSPTPGGEGSASPSPSASAGTGENSGGENSPAPTPSDSPGKKPTGDVKGAGEDKAEQSDTAAQIAEGQTEKEGEMSEKQAELLLRSMKDEEKRVQLDERKAPRHVYNDW